MKLTNYTLHVKALPAAFDGLTIVHLSDLHNARFGKEQQRLLARVREADADTIVITGDVIDSRHTHVTRAADTVGQLCQIAPVYLVTGNHESRVPADCEALHRRASEAGAVVLRNETVTIRKEGQSLCLAGMDDLSFYVKAHGPEAGRVRYREQLNTLTAGAPFTILLSHRPDLHAWYEASGADLVFCGHAHGGQIRLPWIGGIIAPGQGLLPKYTEGVHVFGSTVMVISRGLGNSLFPLRINNPPEVVAVTLHCAE